MSQIICSNPECQTTAGCKCRRPFGVNFTWGHVKDLQTAKISELEAEITRLRAENANIRRKTLEEAETERYILQSQLNKCALELENSYTRYQAHVAQIAALLQVCADARIKDKALAAIRALAKPDEQAK